MRKRLIFYSVDSMVKDLGNEKDSLWHLKRKKLIALVEVIQVIILSTLLKQKTQEIQTKAK